ncbi:MAG: PASTA domain-containing protein [Bacteroidetes bacterium]|nr:PASTA domain-containing protein [Bacteroidota bacterium]
MKKISISIIAAIVLVVLMVLGANQFLSIYTRHDEKIPVPALYGLEVPEMQNLLDELGLRYEIRDSLFEEGMPRNAVLQQDPDTGEFVKEGRIIYVSINASESPKILMPDLNQKNIHQAIMILESLGLKVGKIDTTNHIAEDAVIEQWYKGKKIRPDEVIGQGSVIDLVIGDGGNQSGVMQDEVDIPDLEGLNYGDARILLDAYGLRLGTVVVKGVISDSSQATILSQIPSYSPGTKIKRGSKVSLTIKEKI